jgi:hypothetical protein
MFGAAALCALAFGVSLAALPGAAGPLTPPSASADTGDDAGERRINRTKGRGLRACRAARARAGGGICTRVVLDDDDRERYEVRVLRGGFRYEIDLSRTYRVLEVERERIDDDEPGDDDDGGGGGSDDPPGDDNGGDDG